MGVRSPIPHWRTIREVFFDAASVGWAGVEAPEKGTIVELPGSKTITFVDPARPRFKVTDCYVTAAHSDGSSGFKIIAYDNNPVWIMSFGGRYEEGAIDFLKSCLRIAYVERRRFYAGRGPLFVRGKTLTYINRIERDDFNDFECREEIFQLNEESLGYHWCRGGLL